VVRDEVGKAESVLEVDGRSLVVLRRAY